NEGSAALERVVDEFGCLLDGLALLLVSVLPEAVELSAKGLDLVHADPADLGWMTENCVLGAHQLGRDVNRLLLLGTEDGHETDAAERRSGQVGHLRA